MDEECMIESDVGRLGRLCWLTRSELVRTAVSDHTPEFAIRIQALGTPEVQTLTRVRVRKIFET